MFELMRSTISRGVTMRIAIVDDESVFRKQITDSIHSLYGKGDVSCFHYADGKELIAAFENGFELDAVFLDIEMKQMDGMKTARIIRTYSDSIPIIFMTSHTEMAMDGYEVSIIAFRSSIEKSVHLLIVLPFHVSFDELPHPYRSQKQILFYGVLFG